MVTRVVLSFNLLTGLLFGSVGTDSWTNSTTTTWWQLTASFFLMQKSSFRWTQMSFTCLELHGTFDTDGRQMLSQSLSSLYRERERETLLRVCGCVCTSIARVLRVDSIVVHASSLPLWVSGFCTMNSWYFATGLYCRTAVYEVFYYLLLLSYSPVTLCFLPFFLSFSLTRYYLPVKL